MHFPVAGIEISPLVPLLVAFSISLVTSTGGVSGAFLLLPFQMSVLGFVTPAASATNHLFNVVAIPGGVARYVREERMLWPLAWTVAAGTVPGVVLGTLVRVRWLPDPGRFRIFAGGLLLVLAVQMIHALLAGRRASPGSSPAVPEPAGAEPADWSLEVAEAGIGRVAYTFRGGAHAFRPAPVILLALVVGVAGGAYGVGGGALMAPLLISLFALPVHTVAGAALFGTFLTSLFGVASFQVLAPLHPGLPVAPDWRLGLLFGLGGLAGTWCGAWAQRWIPDAAIRWMLAGTLVFVGLRYVL
jgi:uncharacterized membrane protein YfcA